MILFARHFLWFNEPCVYIRLVENKSSGQIMRNPHGSIVPSFSRQHLQSYTVRSHYREFQFSCQLSLTCSFHDKETQSAWSLHVIDWNATLDWRLWIIEAFLFDVIWPFSTAADKDIFPPSFIPSLLLHYRKAEEWDVSNMMCASSRLCPKHSISFKWNNAHQRL